MINLFFYGKWIKKYYLETAMDIKARNVAKNGIVGL